MALLTDQASGSILPKPLAAEIAAALQRDIIGGLLRPGQRLVERELIRRFGVSSIPVREALLELESRGLVVRRHNVGCSVIQLTPAEALRICQLRRVLEPKVVEWAAERITAEALDRLTAQSERLRQAAASGDIAAFFQEDLTFHRMVWEAADNPYAARTLETLMGSLFASGMTGSRDTHSIDTAEETLKHQRLLDALSEHDPQRAALALLEIAAGFEKHLPKAEAPVAAATPRP